MSEFQPRPSELERIQFGERSLSSWHDWLNRDETGEWRGDDVVPCSRYGRDGAECAWWALAYELSYEALGGVHDHPEEYEAGMSAAMSDVVNDAEYVAAWIALAWPQLPEALREQLGELEDVTRRLHDE